jgi:ATP-dependent DNA helicase RecQ
MDLSIYSKESEMAFKEDQLLDALTTVLEQCAPPGSTPKPGQLEALEALLIEQKNVLLHQSTAWGKSAVFWAATLANRRLGRKATLQISPLLSLQRDQAASARKAGLSVVVINSETKKQLNESLLEISDNAADVVICTPEQVAKPNFAEWINEYIDLVAIDEAHCVSKWGYSFRPEYAQLVQLLKKFEDVRLIAATATAPSGVIDDIKYLFGGDLHVIQGPLENPSLSRHVLLSHRPEKRLLNLDAFLNTQDEPGVIYAFEIQAVETVAAELKRSGHNVEAYHSDISSSKRLLLEERWFDNDVTLVSTSALGVGVHKDRVPFVVNYGTPLSPTEFFQQSGRGGRDGSPAISLLLPDSASDNKRARETVNSSMPSMDLIETVYRRLRKNERPMQVSEILQSIGIKKEKVVFNLKFLAAEGALQLTDDGYVCVQTDWEMDEAHWERVRLSRLREAKDMIKYSTTLECLDRFIRQRVGEEMDRNYVCNMCTNCLGGLPHWLKFGI